MTKTVKKVLCTLLVLGILLASSVMAFAATSGDVNSDSKVNSTDALCILKHSVGQTPSGFNKSTADMNADGKINSIDALIVLKISVGMADQTMSKEEIVKFYNDSLKKSYEQFRCTLVISTDVDVTVNEFLMNGQENPEMTDMLENILSNTEYEDEKYTFFKGKTINGEKAEDVLASIELESSEIKSATAVKYGDGYKLTFNLFAYTQSADDMAGDMTDLMGFEYATAEYPNTEIIAITDATGRISSIDINIPCNFKASTTEAETQINMDVSLTQTSTYTFSY